MSLRVANAHKLVSPTAIIYDYTSGGTDYLGAIVVTPDAGLVIVASDETDIGQVIIDCLTYVDKVTIAATGTWQTPTEVNVAANQEVKGPGWNLEIQYTGSGLQFITLAGDHASIKNLELSVASGAGPEGQTVNTIYATTIDYPLIENVYFDGNGDALTADTEGNLIYFNDVDYALIKECKFKGANGGGMVYYITGVAADFIRCEFTNPGDDGTFGNWTGSYTNVYMDGVDEVIIIECFWHDISGYSIVGDNLDYFILSDTKIIREDESLRIRGSEGAPISHVLITNCIFHTAWGCVSVDHAYRTVISHNVFAEGGGYDMDFVSSIIFSSCVGYTSGYIVVEQTDADHTDPHCFLIIGCIVRGSVGRAAIWVKEDAKGGAIIGCIIRDNGKSGIELLGGDNTVVSSCFVYNSGEAYRAAIYVFSSSSVLLFGCWTYEGTPHGIAIGNGGTDIAIVSCYVKSSVDNGINIDGAPTLQTFDTLVSSCYFIDNGAYGCSIVDDDVFRTRLHDNYFDGNTSGPLNDTGTDTILPQIIFPFIYSDGGYSPTPPPYGWLIDAAGEYAVAHGYVRRGWASVIRVKIRAVSNVAEADAMELDIDAYGSAPNEVYTTETISIAGKDSDTTNFSADDDIEWSFTESDDSDLGDLMGDDTFTIVVSHAVAADGNAATDAVFKYVVMEYV